jgi:hypothetical protein
MSTYTGIVPIGKRYPQRIGSLLIWVGHLTHTASYATGGDTLTAKSLGMNVIEGGMCGSTPANTFAVLVQTDGTAKLLATVQATAAQVANATNLSATSSFVIIVGH